MAVAEAIRTQLLATSGVTSLLGLNSFGGTRAIFTGDTEQKSTAPRIEIHELNTDPYVVMEGTSGLRSVTIDVDCKAATLSASKSLADAVETAINDFTSSNVKAVVMQDRGNSVEAPADGTSKASLYVTTLDYLIHYSP